jgi:hypothetical protein
MADSDLTGTKWSMNIDMLRSDRSVPPRTTRGSTALANARIEVKIQGYAHRGAQF